VDGSNPRWGPATLNPFQYSVCDEFQGANAASLFERNATCKQLDISTLDLPFPGRFFGQALLLEEVSVYNTVFSSSTR
jgi:hypothetical protein